MEWIVENKVIEFIFVENPHSELIKRASGILYVFYYYDNNTFPEHYIDLIWASCQPEKHEDIIRASFELLKEITLYLPLERLT